MNNKVAIYVRVSTDEQRDNGYSLDSQLRMLKEYADKNNYNIVGIYNDAGYSGKNLMRPEMQRLLKDIEDGKIDILLAIKTDRLTRDGYDGYWLLHQCDKYNVRIELTLEPFDISTANGEMMFGLNLAFGQRERKEISARTKRGLEQMAIEHKHPNKPPYGYTRDPITKHLEIEPIEAEVVKDIFNMSINGIPYRQIAEKMRNENRYLKRGKWSDSRVCKILDNEIYIGTFRFGKYNRKKEEQLVIENYCKPIISKEIWNKSRKQIKRNCHENYGKHTHIFSNLVVCPHCGNILSSTFSHKKTKDGYQDYYFLVCKNKKCTHKGLHYSCDRLERTLSKLLNELIIYMSENPENIIKPKIDTNKDFENIEKAIQKLKQQEEKLVELYLSSSLDVETINRKNEMIKSEITELEAKKKELNYEEPLDIKIDLIDSFNNTNLNNYLMNKELPIYQKWLKLDPETKKLILHKFIRQIEISRDEEYFIDITNIKFEKQYFNKNADEFLNDLMLSLREDYKGFEYKQIRDMDTLLTLYENYNSISVEDYLNNTNNIHEDHKEIINNLVANQGVLVASIIIDNKFIDEVLFIPKMP